MRKSKKVGVVRIGGQEREVRVRGSHGKDLGFLLSFEQGLT